VIPEEGMQRYFDIPNREEGVLSGSKRLMPIPDVPIPKIAEDGRQGGSQFSFRFLAVDERDRRGLEMELERGRIPYGVDAPSESR
jgi:hypothetical protein